MQVAALLNVKN